MRTVEGRVVCSPTDLVGYLACPHLTNLQRAERQGLVKRPVRADPQLDLLMEKGIEHEEQYLSSLSNLTVIEIPQDDHSEAGLLLARERTIEAMRSGADVIYQATFVEQGYSGQADFLRRVEIQSGLGAWSYEPEDTKLALSAKAGAVVQLLTYSQMIEVVQGVPPEQLHVILGRSEDPRRTFRVADFAAYHRLVTRRHLATVAGPAPTEATATQVVDPVEHCTVCAWGDHCRSLRWKSGHLSGVAFIRRDEVEKLRAAGIMTIAELGRLDAEPRPIEGITAETLARLADQAAMQLEELRTGVRTAKILDHATEPPLAGLLALPEPSPGDLYFDFEGDRFAEADGLEYLFGYVEPPPPGVDPGDAPYTALWAHDRPAEKVALEQFLDLVMRRRAADPGMHVYHYAPYEPSALHRLTQRHGTREEELDVLLRAGVFVDLYRVVRQGVRVSSMSYSIKRLERLYDLIRDDDGIAKALSSVIAYERWRANPDQALLDDIASYNRDDCVSTLLLQGWLEERRTELVERLGMDPGRPTLAPGDPAEDQREADAETAAVKAALTADIALSAAEDELSDEQRARRLLGDLLAWHRREGRSEWFDWFRLSKLEGDDLAKENAAVAVRPGAEDAGSAKKSRLWRWRFDPAQETRLHVGEGVVALPLLPKLDKGGQPTGYQDTNDYGEIVEFSQEAGEVVVKVGPSKAGRDPDRIAGFLGSVPLRTTDQRASLLELGRWVAANGVAADGPARAVRDILLRRPPRLADRYGGSLDSLGTTPGAAARTAAALLDDSYLAIQGPPGSGKTHVGAEIILDLVRQARASGEHRVIGVTAFSHAAVGNLLAKVVELAKPGDGIRILQKADEAQRTPSSGVTATTSNTDVEVAIASGEVDVVGGTSWLWSRPAFAGSLDTLLVDEAGQISLANVSAIGRSTHNLVLLGDPQQLSQPLKGAHPPGAEKSVLEHVVGPHQAIEPELGILLAETRRLHPSICAFTSELFYEGKLRSLAGLDRQAIGGPGDWLSGSGLRYVPVSHEGRSSASPEEAEEAARLVRNLLTRTWTNADGAELPLKPKDILVVSPYNAQVARLRQVLPDGVRAGTVDKFQGQQAPVVLYSMATSTPDDMPRDMGFLFSLNRFNVATSRAQALVVVLANAALLSAPCHTPEQMRLVNALARYVEIATAS